MTSQHRLTTFFRKRFGKPGLEKKAKKRDFMVSVAAAEREFSLF
jgi:hypothetical protein